MVVVSIIDILFINCSLSAVSAFELVFAITSCAVIFTFLFLSVTVHFPIIGIFVLLYFSGSFSNSKVEYISALLSYAC